MPVKLLRPRGQGGKQNGSPSKKYLYLLLPDRLGKLVTHLAKGGETQAALTLARSILATKPPAVTSSRGPRRLARHARARPQPRCDKYDYGEVLENHIPHLVAAAGDTRRLIMLCDVLDSALKHVSAVLAKAPPGVF